MTMGCTTTFCLRVHRAIGRGGGVQERLRVVAVPARKGVSGRMHHRANARAAMVGTLPSCCCGLSLTALPQYRYRSSAAIRIALAFALEPQLGARGTTVTSRTVPTSRQLTFGEDWR